MWAIRNETDYAVERAFVRDRDGSEVWVNAVRATYMISPTGELSLAEEQQPVLAAPRFLDNPSSSSLLYESDLIRTREGTDVLLHGSAYAPNGNPVRSVETTLQVGPIHKSLLVHGDRHWEGGIMGFSCSQSAPFVSRKLGYEWALGGLLTSGPEAARDANNPAGIGRVPEDGAPAPSIECPHQPIEGPDANVIPAGYGPIAGHWQPRAKLAGTYGELWEKTRQPLVPEDFDDNYFRCAPSDQQVRGYLQGGEEVILKNLTPSGLVKFRLPRVSLGFRTKINGETVHHRGHLHTVIIEPDESRLILVWHSALPCHHTLYTLKETVVFEKERVPFGGANQRVKSNIDTP